MTSRPIIPGRSYNVDGVTILADNPVGAIIKYLRVMAAHGVNLFIRPCKREAT